jgi:hypothetical protein
MKKFFTLCVSFVAATFSISSYAQVVFNEVYTDPGGGNHEFFEFYNTSSLPFPESMDNYTLLSYYKEGNKTGFYVMDLPDQSIAPRGFYVGASANPFNVQGQSDVIPDFNWNAMPAGGALTKWENNGSGYVQVAVPANLNDFLVTITASSEAKHHLFIYKNGNLINGLITGTNFAIVPSYIKAMPDLPVDMLGASPDFIAVFSSINDNQLEYVNSAAGNDNGYMRINDGKCGVWGKSSNQTQHTPGKTNGSATDVSGELTITGYISEIPSDPEKSLLTYNITSSTLSAFPVTAEVYQDIGIIGELDAADILVDTRILYSTTSGDQEVTLPFRNDPVLLVAISPSGCFDQVLKIENNLSTLPVHLLRFQGNLNRYNKVTLNWTVADNETVSHFEVEKSLNGRDFTTAAIVFASEKTGIEDYQYAETINGTDKVMYRLKMFDKGHDIDYSKILVFQAKTAGTNGIKIFGNPVSDKLTFSFVSDAAQTVQVKVYDVTGKVMLSQKINSPEGNNILSLPLNAAFAPGMYVVEISNGTERLTSKFAKQ